MSPDTLLDRLVVLDRRHELEPAESHRVREISAKVIGRFEDARCLTMEDIEFIERVWAERAAGDK
jgi:hypothetical protein